MRCHIDWNDDGPVCIEWWDADSMNAESVTTTMNDIKPLICCITRRPVDDDTVLCTCAACTAARNR